MSDQPTSLFRQPKAAAASSTPAAAPASATQKMDFIGVATMKNGSVYFGEFKADADSDVIVVKVPTASGDVRTTRNLTRSPISSTRVLDVATVRKLAKIGPHVLAQADVDRVAPAAPAPTTPDSETPPQ